MVYPDTNNSTEDRLKVSSGGPYRTITMQVFSQRAAPKYGQLWSQEVSTDLNDSVVSVDVGDDDFDFVFFCCCSLRTSDR